MALAVLPMGAFAAQMMRDDFVPPVVTVRKLSAGEVAGKSAAQAVWARPASIPKLDFARLGRLPTAKSEVRLAYDDANLYVAFRCFLSTDRPGISATKKTRDENLMKDDSVMVLIEPTNNPRAYFYLAANTLGVQYDERDRPDPASWNGKWNVSIGKEDTAWTAFVTVPFKSLGVAAPKPGATWSANVARQWPPRKEASFWANTLIDFHEPRRTGRLVFAGPEAVTAGVTVPVVNAPGEYPLVLTASNPTAKPVQLDATVMSDGAEVAKLRATAPPGVSEHKLEFRYPHDGWHELSAAVTDDAKKLVTRSAQVPVRSGDFRSKLARFDTLLDEWRLPSSASEDVAELHKVIARFAQDANAAEGSAQAWKAQRPTIEALELSVRRMQALAADKNGVGYAVGTETGARRVLRDKLFEGRFGEPLKISACRDEFESAQVVVLAHSQPLKKVAVSVSALAGPGGAVISEKQVKLDLVDYVLTREPPYEVDYIGWYPDPIVDLTAFDVDARGIRPVWVTVHVPLDAKAGVYRGQITVKPEGTAATVVPVELEVWDFALPTRLHLKTAFAFSEGELPAWYGKPVTDEQRREWYAFLLDHRINPTNIYTKTPIPRAEDMQFCVDRGLNAYTVMCTGYKEGKPLEDVIARIRENQQFTKPKGWWDMAYLYGFDELGRDKYAGLRSTYGAIKKQFPDLQRMTTVIPNEELRGFVDIWVPLTPKYDAEIAKDYAKDGDEVWWYICCNPPHPYPNFMIDYPAIDSRIIFWMNWKYRIPGFLYYMVNLWGPNRISQADKGVNPHPDPAVRKAIDEGKRWPEVPWNTCSCASFNGDGQLIYPGLGGKPWSSLRLECIRDGIEDYEYFYILNELVEKAAKKPGVDAALLRESKRLLDVRSDVVQSATSYTLDPDTMLDARRQVAEMIEKLGK